MDMQYGHAVLTCSLDMDTFFHTYMDIYVYILICSTNFVSFRFAEYFDEILPKQNETWPWQNEI
jgi:hypothetical protein